jgi:hypothetical protein
MNIMNCFSKTQFSLLFHPIFLSFACFGMFHFRNSKFLNETGTSNKTSNIFFQFRFLLRSGCPWRIVLLRLWRLWAWLLECDHPWDAWQHPHDQTKHPTSKTKKTSPLWSQTTSVSHVQLLLWKSWYSKQSSGWSFPDQFTAVSEGSMKFGAPISDRQKPRNGMIQSQKWLVQRWIIWLSQFSLLEPSPCLVGPSYHQASTWVGSPFNLVNSKFWWAKTRSLTAAPSFLLVVSFSRSLCPNLMVLLLLFANSIVYITTC